MGSSQDPVGSDSSSLIEWESPDNVVLLNPRWTSSEAESLQQVALTVEKQFGLQGHLWVATSGSTSESASSNKLVALSKTALHVSARAVNRHLQVTSKDIWLQILPRFHVGGLGIEVRALLSGSRVIQNLKRWDAKFTADMIASEKITLASMVPTQVFDLVQANLKSPPSLRAVIVGGGALTESLYVAARKLGWPLLPSYGMTETCSQIATASLSSLGSRTMPLPEKLDHVQWRLTEGGLLEVKGESLMTCYGQRLGDGSIRGWDPKVHGWFQSEDHATLIGNEIQFLGRGHDFIKIGGEGSSLGRLREIFDRVLLASSSLSHNVALIDAPSERLGTEIHLVHENQVDQPLLLQLKEKYNQEVLPFERIRALKAVSSIPRSDLGKVLWAKLKKELYGD